VLALHDLRHRYPGASALAFPDFEAPSGSRVLLRGPSGSGKSTLIALCAGLLTVQQGSLTVADSELASMPLSRLDAWRGATLGVVPQRLHLSPSLTVLDNLRLTYVSAGLAVDERRLRELLGELALGDLAQRRPYELSVGQAQRVALARALVRRPRVLLVDEPTANLDDDAVSAVLALLMRTAAHSQATLLIASHDARVDKALSGARELVLPRQAMEALG